MIGFDINDYINKELQKHNVFPIEFIIEYCQGHDIRTFVQVQDDQLLYDAANRRIYAQFTLVIPEGDIEINNSRVHFSLASTFFYFDENGINISIISFDSIYSPAKEQFFDRMTLILTELYRSVNGN